MKILGIKLIAFGLFTDTYLEFGNGVGGLYIIYGPNEAGKSCALRAIRQLLYGIPQRSIDNFVHPHKKMRIGGSLRRDDGTVIDFIRRKGKNKTLRTPDDDTAIDESRLRAFLGSVDENLFTTIFGIDHTDLVKGGEEIIQGGGDIGQVLFAAGSGITDLHKILDELQTESDNLFLQAGKKPRINEADSSLKKKQKAIREAQLPSQEWIRHDTALSEALELKQSLDRDLEKKQREKNRLERINEALPIIGHRKELLKDLESCGDAVPLPADFSDRRRDLVTKLRIAENEEKQAIESLEAIDRAIVKIDVPEQLLENADDIEDVYQELGSYRKAAKDRSSLTVKKSSYEGDAKMILQGLRDDLTLEQADELRLGKADTIRIQELGNQHERFITKMEGAKEEKEKLNLRLNSLNDRIAELKEPKDTGQLLKTIEQILQQGALEDNYNSLILEIHKLKRAAGAALEKQPLWTGSLESIETLPVPLLETIDIFDKRIGEAESTIQHQRLELEGLQRSILEMDSQIEQLRLEQEVPTEDDLNRGRQKRDEGWRLVLQVWRDEQEPGDNVEKFVAAFPPETELPGAYELSVQHADEIADRLRREADRVAKKATLFAERQMRKTQFMRLKEQLESNEIELEKINAKWANEWKTAGIFPKSPREMRTWTQDQMVLSDQVSAIRDYEAKADDLKTRIDKYCQELSFCLEEIGYPKAKNTETLIQLLDRSQKAADQIDKARNQRDQQLRDLSQCQEELRNVTYRTQKIEKELVLWRAQWEKAILPLGLKADATPAQAVAVLEDLKTLFEKIKDEKILKKRIQGIDRDAEVFIGKVTRLITKVASDLTNHPLEQSAAKLHSRLTRARTEKARRNSLEKQKQQEEEQLKSARNGIARIKAQLATMCQEAGCKSYEDLPEAEERSYRRQRIQNQLGQIENQIHKLSAGLTINEFINDVLSIDSDSIAPALTRLYDDINVLMERKSELDKTIGREENELSKMDGGARAADLAEEAQVLIARLETDAQQYIRLRIASEVLKKAIESYRDKNQGPILNRSSQIFASMTLGSFEGLRVDCNDKGETVLMGIRAGGKEIIGVEGMSDGTADQLYLAVRLASLESYLEKNEAMPFIIDDILVHFDNERAVATLEILAQLAEKTQIIFFTHHKHLVELAQVHVNKENLFVHSL